MKRDPVKGVDDSRVGPFTMYRNMLKEERQHFEKINKVVYKHPEKFQGLLTEKASTKENGTG